jgi:hypothetical protein
MGMLDDAIREHLELKKRSGAPETEVQRLEAEAFGSVRRAASPEAEPVVEEPEPEAVAPEPELPAEHELPAPPDEPWLEDEPEEPAAHQATSEFTPAEADEAAGRPPSEYVAPDEEEGDDLLEETPEFLQETPEHDRLWFEQKPPRDFDFDQ